MAPSSQNRIGRCFNCRLLVQPLGEQDETMEEKQQRVEHYENMQISAVLQPYPGDGQQPPAHNKRNSGTATAAAAAAAVGLDASDLELALTSVVAAGPAVGGEPQHCLVCVARRIPTKSKRFVHVDTHETDFVMSTHSIIVDDEEDNRMMLMAPDTLKDGQRHHQSVAGSDGLSVSQEGDNPVLTSVVRSCLWPTSWAPVALPLTNSSLPRQVNK